MRFHCGFSFSWRTIKKFLLPILIGLLGILGFNFIYDNKVPLGFIPVYAEEVDDISENDIPDEIQDNYNYWSSVLSTVEDHNIDHKAMFNKVYWFDDNTTDTGILSNIYILLFLYCITMICLRIIFGLKKVGW